MRRILFAGWLVLILFGALLAWRPESSTVAHLVELAAVLSLWVVPVALFRSRQAVMLPGYLLGGVVLVITFAPERSGRADQRQQTYVRALREFDGVPYVWGGENARGIDCSGLVRRSLVNALVSEGLRHTDPSAWRFAAELWWFDASAQALGQGYRGWTREVTRAPSLAALPAQVVHTGDLAVTQDGLHVLAYLGADRWIQADPVPMKVHEDEVDDGSKSAWFRVPVTIVRWRGLE